MRVDTDGKDWDVLINHDNHTITFRANFHSFDASNKASVQKAAENWNAQSAKFFYVIGNGDNAVAYDINYVVTVDNLQNDEVAENSISTLPDSHELFADRIEIINGEEVTIKRQGVSDGKNFTMKESQKDSSRRISHEMGHNLGLTHKRGIMDKEASGKDLKAGSVNQMLRGLGSEMTLKWRRIMQN